MSSIVYMYLPSNNLNIENYDIELQFNSDNAYSYIEDQLDIGYRIPGTQERVNCANYFINKFLEIDSNFTYVLHNFTVYSTECQNVLFKLNENRSNIVILGAHYDSRARATKDLVNKSAQVPGANDGASGCAVLIEIATILYMIKQNLSCQIWFLFFDAEDQGYDEGPGILGWDWCEGSQAFVSDIHYFYDSETENFDCMILLDMVGGENLQFINEQHSTSSLLDELFAIGRELGYISEFPINAIREDIIDDHLAFINFGIPSADLIIKFWDRNPDWPHHHTTQDNISYISKESLKATGDTVEQFIYNNYFADVNDTYTGNYPWSVDKNMLNLDLLISIIIIVAVVGISTILYLYKHQNSEKEVELLKG
ncbi:MAG: M28 family peptidase [Promethearchaeota archaeon]|nr:MAG: M28 family peptidase [Candidatus Lokiarchaeota archaeon]